MRTPSMSSKQAAVLATPSKFIALKPLAMPSKATPAAAWLPWAVCFHKPLHAQFVHNPQPGDGAAHSGSHASHLTSSLQVPGIADDLDKAGGVCTVGYNVSASFKGIEDVQIAFTVRTAGTEAPKPCTHNEAVNAEQHTSHLLGQESSRVGSIDPNYPKPSLTPLDHLVTFPIDQAPASTAVRTTTYNMPYCEAVNFPFAATSGPSHSESVMWIPFTFIDTPDPPSTYAKANSPAEGSANVNSSTAEDWHATLGHASFIDGGTLPQSSQWQKTTPLSTTEHDHIAVAHGNAEALWPCSTISLISRDLMPPFTYLSNMPAAIAPLCSHQHHLQTEHTNVHHHQTIKTGPICPAPCPMDNTLTSTLTKPLPLAKVKHFTASLRLHAKWGGVSQQSLAQLRRDQLASIEHTLEVLWPWFDIP